MSKVKRIDMNWVHGEVSAEPEFLARAGWSLLAWLKSALAARREANLWMMSRDGKLIREALRPCKR